MFDFIEKGILQELKMTKNKSIGWFPHEDKYAIESIYMFNVEKDFYLTVNNKATYYINDNDELFNIVLMK